MRKGGVREIPRFARDDVAKLIGGRAGQIGGTDDQTLEAREERMIRLGGPVFMSEEDRAAGAGESHGAVPDDIAALLRKHKEKGFRAAYAPQLSISDGDRIRAVRNAFEEADIMIAEVGYWANLLDPDEDRAKQHRRSMVEALAIADELGACCAVDVLGSYAAESGNEHDARNFSQEAFDIAVELARFFIDEVKPKRTCFTYEIFPFNVVDSPEALRALIDAVDRDRFGVHMDLVNLVNCPRAYYNSGRIMRQCVSLFGDRIASAHAKDVAMDSPAISVILREVRPGLGNLDIGAYLRGLHELPQEVPFMMEHLQTEEEYDLAASHIRAVAEAEGVAV
ncbi:sugar phosphate isomerase/epimerase family protein [Verrucomicrobiota bacterium]